jgi:hypothetical protein
MFWKSLAPRYGSTNVKKERSVMTSQLRQSVTYIMPMPCKICLRIEQTNLTYPAAVIKRYWWYLWNCYFEGHVNAICWGGATDAQWSSVFFICSLGSARRNNFFSFWFWPNLKSSEKYISCKNRTIHEKNNTALFYMNASANKYLQQSGMGSPPD